MFGKNRVMVPKDYAEEPPNTLKVTSIFYTVQGEGPFAGTPCGFIRLTGCNLLCSFCFVPSTKILMSDGTQKRIDRIQIGDRVMSWNKDHFEPRVVTRVYASIADDLIVVNVNNRRTWCTPEHPFLVSGKGWVPARDLNRGDRLVCWGVSNRMRRERVAEFISNGAIVEGVKKISSTKAFTRLYGSKTAPHRVYNLEVEGAHTYVANSLVVHNCDTFFDAGDRLTYDAIIKRMIAVRADFFVNRGRICPPIPHRFLLVITGGEPLNQPNLTAFLAWCHAWDFSTQIESNGTIDRILPSTTTLVVSPKINERTGKYVRPVMLERADALKFVISKRMEGYQDVPEFALAWRDAKRGRKVYVSPMNRYIKEPIKLGPDGTLEGRSETDERISFWTPGLLDNEQNQENHEYAAELALRYGVNLTLQAHLYASLP